MGKTISGYFSPAVVFVLDTRDQTQLAIVIFCYDAVGLFPLFCFGNTANILKSTWQAFYKPKTRWSNPSKIASDIIKLLIHILCDMEAFVSVFSYKSCFFHTQKIKLRY